MRALCFAAFALSLAACSPSAAPRSTPYAICHTAGCGDNVSVVIDRRK